MDPLQPGQALRNAVALHRQGRLREAEAVYRAVLETAPTEFDALSNLSALLSQTGKPEEALALAQRALQQQPASARALGMVGGALCSLNRYAEAVPHFHRMLAIEPRFAEGYYYLGMALNALGDTEGALQAVERALTHNRFFPLAAEAYYHLRQAMARRGSAPSPEYFAQQGEDALLDVFFNFKTAGYFVDIGAFDGMHLSNSLAFERRGWSGLCVEAVPFYFALCEKNRPRTRCVHAACVGDDRPTVAFKHEASGLFSGVSVNDQFIAATYQNAQVPFDGMRSIEVPAMTLDRLLAGHEGAIDFVSIDVEGTELDVLAGFDLDRWKPRLLLIEANTDHERQRLTDYLAPRGYLFARSLQWNCFYVRSEADRRALRSIAVSAKLTRPPHPLGQQHDRFGYISGAYAYWPAEPV